MPWPPFRLHPPDVPRPRFVTLPLSAERFPASPRVETSHIRSRLVAHVRPYRVCHPTDRWLPPVCSPPRRAATQLSLGTGRRASARRGLAPLCHGTIAGALRVAGRSAGPDEATGDQDHEPSCRRPRFVILISRGLVPRGARRHEHVPPGRGAALPARVRPWRPCRPWQPWCSDLNTRHSAATA